MKIKVLAATLIPLALLLAGCGSKSSSSSSNVSKADATAAINLLTSANASLMGGAAPASVQPMAPVAPQAVIPGTTFNCPVSGTVTVGGTTTFSDVGGTFSGSIDSTYSHCAVSQGSINGSGSTSFSGNASSFSMAITGAYDITVTSGGRSVALPSCSVNLLVNITGGSYAISGTVCGVDYASLQ